ncbi:MAG: imidazole glycerol phosphate synthase subunit HisH [Ruminococcaceae bacterium]|nr:imidazole glycerol phosphate synthase subunit HisH [Oscillospiraceae bacterium]
MIAIIDYGVGNLFSLRSSFCAIGQQVKVTDDAEGIRKADKIILPGVGAFEDAVKKLKKTGLDTVLKEEAEKGKPVMGICLGMQMLFERSFEYGCHEGLGLIKGDIVPFEGKIDASLKIPHIGWNALEIKEDLPVFRYIKNGDHVYFVHSYFAAVTDETVAKCEYGTVFTAAVGKDNIYGCQFHPEKSGQVGLNILKGFCELGG